MEKLAKVPMRPGNKKQVRRKPTRVKEGFMACT
jgi:hypothetical protein